MKIAVVTHYFPSSNDPWAGQSAYQTLRVLAKTHEVHVFVPEPVYPPLLTPRSARKEPLDRNWKIPGVDASYIPYMVAPVVSRPLNGIVTGWKLLPAVRRFAPDIILNYVVYPNGQAAVRIGEKLGVPVVLTAIGSDLNRIADPLCRIMTQRTLAGADFVTTVSGDLAKTARKLGSAPDRTRAILNGCDESIFCVRDRLETRKELGLDADKEIVLYVGRLDHRKGLFELVEAACQLRALRPSTQVYIMGNGIAEAPLREAITRNNATGFVEILAPRSNVEVARWMSAADVVTLPSYNEGCPNVVIEALSAGRPVVATNVGGIPELMDSSCGRLVPARDVPALANALNEVLSTSWSATDIHRANSRSWTDVAADLEGVLTHTLAQHHHAKNPGATAFRKLSHTK